MKLLAALPLLPQDPVDLEGQPLSVLTERVGLALDLLGQGVSSGLAQSLKAALRDVRRTQELLRPQGFLVLSRTRPSRSGGAG